MRAIYEPAGAAKEYSDLALNLFNGCGFGCIYCYVPGILRTKPEDWSRNPQPREGILKAIEKDCKKMIGDKRTVLLCFTSDPYQSLAAGKLTREALLILEQYKMTATVLTKAGMNAEQDFDILRRNDWMFGTTIHCLDEGDLWKVWEPRAANNKSRRAATKYAHERGIKTWVSMEPVIYPEQSLELIREMDPYVDLWKVGKMNHRRLDIDWRKFYDDVMELFEELDADYYIKTALREAAGIR